MGPVQCACTIGAGGIGGTWWWNRYPGARVDGPGQSFFTATPSRKSWCGSGTGPRPSQAKSRCWTTLSTSPTGSTLRRDIQLETWIRDARYDEAVQRWTVETSAGERVSAQFLICAVGTLSAAHKPDFPGLEDFTGECYHTGRWPQEPVSFEGQTRCVVGTGSSGVQAVPEIAREAAHLTVFQRTPQYSIRHVTVPSSLS